MGHSTRFWWNFTMQSTFPWRGSTSSITPTRTSWEPRETMKPQQGKLETSFELGCVSWDMIHSLKTWACSMALFPTFLLKISTVLSLHARVKHPNLLKSTSLLITFGFWWFLRCFCHVFAAPGTSGTGLWVLRLNPSACIRPALNRKHGWTWSQVYGRIEPGSQQKFIVSGYFLSANRKWSTSTSTNCLQDGKKHECTPASSTNARSVRWSHREPILQSCFNSFFLHTYHAHWSYMIYVAGYGWLYLCIWHLYRCDLQAVKEKDGILQASCQAALAPGWVNSFFAGLDWNMF